MTEDHLASPAGAGFSVSKNQGQGPGDVRRVCRHTPEEHSPGAERCGFLGIGLPDFSFVDGQMCGVVECSRTHRRQRHFPGCETLSMGDEHRTSSPMSRPVTRSGVGGHNDDQVHEVGGSCRWFPHHRAIPFKAGKCTSFRSTIRSAGCSPSVSSACCVVSAAPRGSGRFFCRATVGSSKTAPQQHSSTHC